MTTIKQQYEQGLRGATFNREQHDLLRAEVALANFTDVAHAGRFADRFAGDLCVPWVWAAAHYPGCWPAPAQQRGSCVAHNGRNALLSVLVCEVVREARDPVSGRRERAPAVSALGVKQGVLAPEVLYWFSGNGNAKRGGHYVEDGWSSAALARVLRSKAGAVVRGPLASTGVDLTKYSPEAEGQFSKNMPASVADAIDNQLVREVAEVRTFEEVRDALGKGFALLSDGSESWSAERDAHGVSRRTTAGWAHAMAILGADDRPDTHNAYGEPLVLIANSWGKWNRGPRAVRDSARVASPAVRQQWTAAGVLDATGSLQIPDGWFWSRWSDAQRRRMYAISGVNGWAVPDLPDLSGGWK